MENLQPMILNTFSNSYVNMTKYLTLLSLYFSKYPFLLNLLSIQEIKNLFQVQVTTSIMINTQFSLMSLLENLYKK